MYAIFRTGEWKLNYPHQNLIKVFNDVLKDKKFYLEKAIARIQLKRSRKYFYQIQCFVHN